jgi:hypothetical protein
MMICLLAAASATAAAQPVHGPEGDRYQRNRVGDLPGKRSDAERGRAWIEEQRRTRNQAETHEQEMRRERRIREQLSTRPYDGEWDERVRQRAGGANVPREGSQPPLGLAVDDRNSPRRHWRADWRSDRRYDWRTHRERNRWIFNLGNYRDPFGWTYRRFDVGRRLWPEHYSARYWLDDPWQYRLPPAYPGTRWIRYHGDTILVDTWTGEVIDVVYGVFW